MAFDIVLWTPTNPFDIELTDNIEPGLPDPTPSDTSTTSEVISFDFSLNFTDSPVVTSEPAWSRVWDALFTITDTTVNTTEPSMEKNIGFFINETVSWSEIFERVFSWIKLRVPKGSYLTIEEFDYDFTQLNALKLERKIAIVTPSANITLSTDNQTHIVENLNTNTTFEIPSGAVLDGQTLVLKIRDNGSSRTLSWTTSSGGYRVIGVTLPSYTISGKWLIVGCIYNSADGYWDVLSIARQ